jgi:hypothetical protein
VRCCRQSMREFSTPKCSRIGFARIDWREIKLHSKFRLYANIARKCHRRHEGGRLGQIEQSRIAERVAVQDAGKRASPRD